MTPGWALIVTQWWDLSSDPKKDPLVPVARYPLPTPTCPPILKLWKQSCQGKNRLLGKTSVRQGVECTNPRGASHRSRKTEAYGRPAGAHPSDK